MQILFVVHSITCLTGVQNACVVLFEVITFPFQFWCLHPTCCVMRCSFFPPENYLAAEDHSILGETVSG